MSDATARNPAPDPAGPIYVFGDSLSDDGVLYAQTAGLVADAVRDSWVGPGGQFSDGPTHAEVLEGLVGGPPGDVYAVGGARAAGTQTLADYAAASGDTSGLLVPIDDPRLAWDMNLGAQVDRFLADHGAEDLSGATAILLVGGNDLNTLDTAPDPLAVIGAAVAATLAAAADLSAAGVGDVVIETLPPLPLFPLYGDLSPEDAALADFAFALYADQLAAGAAALAAGGAAVRVLDLSPLGEALLDDAGSFGLLAPLDLTLTSGDPALAGFDADQVAFWDALHPSAATHGIIAAYEEHALASDPVALGAGDDRLGPARSADLVLAYGGADQLDLAEGDDSAFGGSGADRLEGGTGWDLLAGGAGGDSLEGARGRDLLADGAGSDVAAGGRGADALVAGRGSDDLRGGGGADTLVWTEAALIGGAGGDRDAISGGAGRDTLVLALSPASYALWADDLEGGSPGAALAALGIDATRIEEIVVVEGRAGLDAALGAEAWYASADLWGLL